MDISGENPLRARTQEDTLSLWFKVLPMKRGCKGRAPSLWHHYFLACPEQKGLHVVNAAFGELWKWGGYCVWGGTAEDARLLFPCSPQPMKTLENGTFPSAKADDTATPGKAWVNIESKAVAAGAVGCGGLGGRLRGSVEMFQICLAVWYESSTYYQPPVFHLG